MNKKLIAAAIAAVMVAPAVSAADTTLYGKVWMAVTNNSNSGAGTTDNWSVDDGFGKSRLGVKGSEDLGNGLKAIFQYETAVNVTNGGAAGGTFGGARNAYLGLAGDFGTFLAGRHDTPAKIAYYSVKNDVMDGTVMDLNFIASGSAAAGLSRKTFTEVRADNAIAYVSPSFSGFTAAVAVVPGQGTSPSPLNNANGLADAYSLGLMYAGGGLKASVGYEVLSKDFLFNGLASTATQDDQKMWQAGASYTFGDFMVGANYQHTSSMIGVKNADSTAWALVGKANFGNNYVAANYGNFNGDAVAAGARVIETAATTPDANGYGLAVGHVFSKRTQVYAAYHAVSTDGNAANPNQDLSRFSLGMIHSF